MKSISELPIPDVPETATIFDQWESAAKRVLSNLQRNSKAYIFNSPVDVEELDIPDYYQIVKKPMDFGTIKTKLKEHKYQRIEEFIEDMELVFYNCKLYNGVETDVGQIGVQLHEEFQN